LLQSERYYLCTISLDHKALFALPLSSYYFQPCAIHRKVEPSAPPNPMQFYVYLKAQSLSEEAPHRSPRALASMAVTRNMARIVGQNAIQLTRDMSWKEVKRILRGGCDPDDSGRLNPPTYHTLPYTYPLPLDLLRSYQ
jgi:hypothetical protein